MSATVVAAVEAVEPSRPPGSGYLVWVANVIGALILGGVVSIMTRRFFVATRWWVVMLTVAGTVLGRGCLLLLSVGSVRVNS